MTRVVLRHLTLPVRSLPRLVLVLLVAGWMLVPGSAAHAAGTPEQQCQATKNKTAGKYAACRQSAEARLATSGDTGKYNDAITKCGTKFGSAWQKAIDKAAAAGATCLDAPLTGGDFQTILAESSDNVADALAGLGLVDCTADLATCTGDLGTCTGDLGDCATDLTQAQGDLATCTGDLGTCSGDLATCLAEPPGQRLQTGQTACYDAAGTVIACAGTGQDGELQKGLARAYVDNGDGTITDTRTGLMWEKLSDDGTIHDKDTAYNWTDAFAVKVAALNGGGGFAGYTDWRLPNANELQSLVSWVAANPSVDAAFNTGCTGGCTVATCSCTQSLGYWSSTTAQLTAANAFFVVFGVGQTNIASKTGTGLWVRGVRGGS